MGQVFHFLLIAGLIALGAAGLVQAFRLWRRVVATRSWNRTEGVVTASTVDSRVNPGKTDFWIEYTYTVANTEYTSRTIGFSASVRPRSQADRIARHSYYVGGSVLVYYDPRDPEKAMLRRDMPWGELSMLLLGSLAALLWALILIMPHP